jgi:hypothetical protein
MPNMNAVLSTDSAPVHGRDEYYKLGWVSGFYGCVTTTIESGLSTAERSLFAAGYDDGWSERENLGSSRSTNKRFAKATADVASPAFGEPSHLGSAASPGELTLVGRLSTEGQFPFSFQLKTNGDPWT